MTQTIVESDFENCFKILIFSDDKLAEDIIHLFEILFTIIFDGRGALEQVRFLNYELVAPT